VIKRRLRWFGDVDHVEHKVDTDWVKHAYTREIDIKDADKRRSGVAVCRYI